MTDISKPLDKPERHTAIAIRIVEVFNALSDPFYDTAEDPVLAGYVELYRSTYHHLKYVRRLDFSSCGDRARIAAIEAVMKDLDTVDASGMEATTSRLEQMAEDAIQYVARYRGQEGSKPLIDQMLAKAKGFRTSAEALRKGATKDT